MLKKKRAFMVSERLRWSKSISKSLIVFVSISSKEPEFFFYLKVVVID